MVAGVDDPETAERALALGTQGYLVKPFWPGQLQVTAASALRQYRLELAERARHAALLGSAEEETEALRHELIEAQRKAIADLRASRQETVERLVRAIEMHDPETGRHVSRMAAVAALLGEKLGLDREPVLLRRADARCRQDRHPRRGAAEARRADLERAQADGVAHDRRPPDPRRAGERPAADGGDDRPHSPRTLRRQGYPEGLSGEEIPFEGRIVAVADVFDALLSDRPYRPAFSLEEAVRMIGSERGTHFDPES
jgi:response regulator RpfG family c-di-GMP phosphodiesterase